MASLPSPMRNRNGFSSMRLLGVLKQQESATEDRSLEFEEADVWGSPFSAQPEPHSPVDRRSPTGNRRRIGLSSAPPEDQGPPIQRRRSSLAKETLGLDGLSLFAKSAPVSAPAWPKSRREWIDRPKEEEMVPPHLIVARSQVNTFSVFEGMGRTLKGRDLRRVRNAVFQKTGFLE